MESLPILRNRTRSLRFALVYPPFDDKRDRSAYYVAPPLGLLYLASYLEQAGHSVSVHDFVFDLKVGRIFPHDNLYKQCAEQILANNPDVVGFSTQCSTSPGSLNIARHLKQLQPSIKIILGGHDVSFIAQPYLEAFDFIDYVLSGEAELTVPKLAEAILGERSLSQVTGLAYRLASGDVVFNGGAERVDDLDMLLPPAYHLVDRLDEYFKRSRVPTILIDSGRGCAFACEFCQTTLLNGPKVRYRTVDSLISELKDYQSIYGDFEAYFVHDLFTARRSFVQQLSERLIDENLGLSWQCRCRLDQVDKPLLNLMGKAGCRMLLYGVESGSEKTLEIMNKHLRRNVSQEVVKRVKWTVDAGIFPSLSMVVGIPEERFEDLNATMELAAEFVKIGRVNAFIQLMSPLPGTPLAKRLSERFEYRGEDAPTAFSQGIEFANGSRLPEDEAIISIWPQIFQSFYTVVPDHGDLDICIDISLAYCKLLEVYCYTFVGLAEHMGLSLLEFFRLFRDQMSAERPGKRGLNGIKDSEIWNGFKQFAERMMAEKDAPPPLRERFRFEQMVDDIAVSPPIATDSVIPESSLPISAPFRLRQAARLFKTDCATSWIAERLEADATGEQSFLLFMTSDRLEIVQLQPILGEALEYLDQLNQIGNIEPGHYKSLFKILHPLNSLSVLEFVQQTPA